MCISTVIGLAEMLKDSLRLSVRSMLTSSAERRGSDETAKSALPVLVNPHVNYPLRDAKLLGDLSHVSDRPVFDSQ